MTKNTNIKSDEDAPNFSSRGKSLEPKEGSLFGKVLKRRKSRQSNYGPGCLDFDYAGNSAPYHHLI